MVTSMKLLTRGDAGVMAAVPRQRRLAEFALAVGVAVLLGGSSAVAATLDAAASVRRVRADIQILDVVSSPGGLEYRLVDEVAAPDLAPFSHLAGGGTNSYGYNGTSLVRQNSVLAPAAPGTGGDFGGFAVSDLWNRAWVVEQSSTTNDTQTTTINQVTTVFTTHETERWTFDAEATGALSGEHGELGFYFGIYDPSYTHIVHETYLTSAFDDTFAYTGELPAGTWVAELFITAAVRVAPSAAPVAGNRGEVIVNSASFALQGLATPVPLPAAGYLLGAGLLGVATWRSRARR